MQSMAGVVTIVQEGRFQLLDDDGVVASFYPAVQRRRRARAASGPAEPACSRILHEIRAG